MANHTSSFDAVIVGGGVIGLAAAWRAAQRGLAVVVLERELDPGRGTSRVAAGMLAPISEALPSEQPLLRLGLASAARYPAFVAELEQAAGRDPGYMACGTLLAARDRDEVEELERELAVRTGLGLPVTRLRASQARALEPGLAPTLRLALEIPDDHAVDPRRLTAALAAAVARAGGVIRTASEVARVALAGERVAGVELAGGERVRAEQVVIAAGPWSGAVSGIPEPARVPVHPVKGQILRLHDPAGPGLLRRVLRMRTGYVVPRGDGRYVLGATVEERGFDTTVTAGAVFELLRDASELVPGIAELVIDELSAGVRPATPDNAPAIGAGALPGLLWATGHYRHGILLAPVTADIVGAALAGDDPAGATPADGLPPDLLDAFAPDPLREGAGVIVTVNGERRELPPDATIASVVGALAASGARDGRGVAVALEGEVVPRGAWARTRLSDGAHVEVVAAVQGG